MEQRPSPADLALPAAPAPVGNYRRGIVHRGMGFLSGQLPFENGTMRFTGLVGRDLSVDEGRAAARLAAINALAQIRELLGDLSRLERLIRVDGLVACPPDFTRHPAVLDGASDFLVDVLGERGWHARSVGGVASLPMNAAVELVVTFAAADSASTGS
jgi:enamine deaminase RidA (YjgF/YER057c/UK114 family)